METYRRTFIRHQLSKRLASTMYSGTGGINDYRPATNTIGRQTNMHTGLVYQMRKSRGINWTHEEKVLLVRLCAAKARIIEEKKSDSNTLRMKAACWKVIYDQFSSRFGRKRTLVRIKEQWKRMKLATRAEQRDREQEVMESTGNGSSNTQESVPTKYYGESAEIIAQVKNILSQFANSSLNFVPVPQTEMCTGEPDVGADAIVRYPDIVTGELPSDVRHSTPEPPESEPMVIKIEIDDEEDDHSDDHSKNRNSNSTPEPDIGIIDFNSLEEIGPERHGNSDPNPGHAHIQASGYNLPTDDITQNRFSTDFALNVRTSTPEVHMPSYDQGQSSEQWGYFRKSKPNSHKSDFQEANNSRSVVDDTVLEYARVEHEKKMEYLKQEHEMKLEILKLKRETARAKLRKANFKLSLSGANLPT